MDVPAAAIEAAATLAVVWPFPLLGEHVGYELKDAPPKADGRLPAEILGTCQDCGLPRIDAHGRVLHEDDVLASSVSDWVVLSALEVAAARYKERLGRHAFDLFTPSLAHALGALGFVRHDYEFAGHHVLLTRPDALLFLPAKGPELLAQRTLIAAQTQAFKRKLADLVNIK